MKTYKWMALLALLAAPTTLLAQDELGEGLPPPAIPDRGAAPLIAEGESVEQAPAIDESGRPTPIPPKVEGEDPEVDVNIRRRGNQVIEEYSVGGRIYMVKVTSENGIPYFYIDSDGDGSLESRIGENVMEPVKPAQYKLLEWD